MSRKLDRIYRAEIMRIAPDTSDLTLQDGLLKPGEAVLIRSIHVIDITTKNKQMRIGYDRGGTKFWFHKCKAGTNNYNIYLNGEIVLVEGERLIGMVESPAASDECWLIARGEFL